MARPAPVIVAALSWYDEPVDWLRECVESVRFCDYLIAVDGAYADFPHDKPCSPPEQARAILAAAEMDCTLHAQPVPWASEVEKRNSMLRMTAAVGADWVLRIDADEVVTDVPGDLREQLARASRHVAEATFMQEMTPGWPLWPSQLRCLFRALPDLGVSGAHSRVVATVDGEQVSLAGPVLSDCEPAETIEGFRMRHRSHERSGDRKSKKQTYYGLLPLLER